MSLIHRSLLALGLTFGTASAAHAWEPVPGTAYFMTVTRVTDVGAYSGAPNVALADAPGPVCVAQNARGLVALGYSDHWIGLGPNGDAGQSMLSVAMFARAQNLPVAVLMEARNGGQCAVLDIHTCADPTSCVPAPAAP